MLQDIRDNSQGVIAKVIIGLIVAVFALFGVESIIGGFVAAPPVAEINGEEITEGQLQISTQNLLASIGGNPDSMDQGLLEQIALSQIVEEVILRQLAEGEAMVVSSDRVDRSMMDNPSFQINGVFDSDVAIRTMASQGYSVSRYRETLRQQMLLSQIASAITSSNFITEAELERIVSLSSQSRDFRYLSIPLGTRTLGTSISDAAIESYYSDHQADFTQEERVIVRYVMLDQQVIADEIGVDEADVRAQYEQERASFEGSAEKRAAHILFDFGDMDRDEALAAAQAAQERLQAGEDFAALALELSSDTVSAREGGDIGYTDGSAFPTEIETALESLTLDEVSGPVATEFGVHLVKLTEAAENVFPEYDEVAPRIEQDLKSAEVDLIYGERLSELSNLAFESADLQPINEVLQLPVLQSQPISRSGGTGIFSNSQVVASAFSDEVLFDGNNSDVIELNDTQTIVLRVDEFIEAAVQPLDEVQAEIAVLLRTDMEREAVQELGMQLQSSIESGDDVEQLLQENELDWNVVEGATRNDIVANREIIEAAFQLPKPANAGDVERTSLTLANGTFVLLELQNVMAGSFTELPDPQRETITESLMEDLGNSDFSAFLTKLRADADIETNLPSEQF